MKDKKLQIFVSSTYSDLRDERQAAVEAILSSGHIPAGMELFSAGDESQMTVIERWIDESDVYLLILGGRYGSVDLKTGKSYTQLEYEYATSRNKPSFSVVVSQKGLDEKVKVLGRSAIEELNNKELHEFRSNVLTKLVKFWDDTKDIKIAIHETLADFSYRKELIGWVKGDNTVNTGALAEEIARLTKENFELRSKLGEIKNESNALYAGLSYSQLEGLLKKDLHEIDGKESNLFNLIMNKGEDMAARRVKFIASDITKKDRELFDKLVVYKLVQEVGTNDYTYILTETGHNFYLRTLVNSKGTK